MNQKEKYELFKGQTRLPTFAVPKHYDLMLKLDLSACTFEGAVDINLNIVEETRFLVLNVLELVVGEAQFKGSDQQEVRPSDVVVDDDDEILVLIFNGALAVGEGTLRIRFSGVLDEHPKGLYRSTYVVGEEKKNMAVTQFAAVETRRCFPCWDEPALKATFKVTVEVPSELIALSNMPIVDEKVNGDFKTVYFEKSPVMSCYLVALIVGLLDRIEETTSDGTKVRVYCPVGKSDSGKFALKIAISSLEIYKNFFSTPYPLPKLDMAAVPDFVGAMENYGLIISGESDLLYDEFHSAAANKQWVAIVVAHEVAHMWFGNLVTMEWWTDIWLNEGFATWASYLAIDTLFPEWKMWNQFLEQTTGGLRLDALEESHPIEVEVSHPRSLDEIFDAISYNKGSAVIRMLQGYLGYDVFQRSLASYIKRYACSNAKTKDLWSVLEEESGEPVTMLMNSWTKQKGYPVVSVTVEGQKLEFEQSQFLSIGAHGDEQWIVPLTLCCGSYDACKNFLLQTKSESLDITKFLGASVATDRFLKEGNQNEWIKLNVEQTGFYRVKYDDDLSARLRYAIEANFLSAGDRFGVLDDSFALCMACKLNLCSLLRLMSAYREEVDYNVLSHLINVSSNVARVVADALPELLDYIKQFFINIFQHSAEKLGWEPRQGESHLDGLLREKILIALAIFGHDWTRNEAITRFCAFLEDRKTALLPPDTRKAAYAAVMQTASASNRWGYESLLRIYRESDLREEKIRVLRSLTSCPDPDITLEALNFLLSSQVRSQDAFFGLAGLSIEGRDTAWKWLKDNWDHIVKTYGSGFLITRFVSTIVSLFSSHEKAAEVEDFFANRSKTSIERTLKQSLERVHINANWVQSVQDDKSLAEALHCSLFRYDP